MLFAAVSIDKPNSLEMRMANRPPHLEWLKSLGADLKLAGPLLDPTGENPIGSLVVIEAESLDAAEAIYAADPFREIELFESWNVRPWRIGFGSIA